MVLHGELLHVGYAAALRTYLLSHFSSITIIAFFKQKTADEISTREWSSDVCSSDLAEGLAPPDRGTWSVTSGRFTRDRGPPERSEERRVGKECRSRWSPDH